MAADSETAVYRVPVRLILNPTDLGTAPAYGGTQLGIAGVSVLTIHYPRRAVVAEEFGEVADVVRGGPYVSLTTIMRQWDADAIGLIWPSTSTGSSTGDKVIDIPGSARAGSLLSASSCKILGVPRDLRADRPSFLLYKALPLVSEQAELRFAVGTELAVQVSVFQGIRDSSARILKVGQLADLSL